MPGRIAVPTTAGLVGPPVVYGHLRVVAMKQRGFAPLHAEPLGSPRVEVTLAAGGSRELDFSGLPADTWTRKGFAYGYQDLVSLDGSPVAPRVPGWEGVTAKYFHVAVGGIGPGLPLVVDLDGSRALAVQPGTLAELDRASAGRLQEWWSWVGAAVAVAVLSALGLVATLWARSRG